MSTPQEGIEQLEVRTKWQHEAHDFTPWLALNLDVLGNELGMKLELVQQEKPVGPLSLDILAREVETGAMVAIENQLEWTDTLHLGQLLTYATGCNAHIAIWVATEFRYEYAEALHRLNEWTNEGIRFYAVKVELMGNSGDSGPVPRFSKVVYPGGWDKDVTLPPVPPMPPHVQKHHDFYRPLIDELIRADFADKTVYQYGHTGRFFPSRISDGVGYAVSLEGRNDAWVTLHIQTESNELTKRIFDALQNCREDIESRIDAGPSLEWHWRRYDRYTFSSINIRSDGSIDDPPEEMEQTRAWMLDLLPQFKEVFDPSVADIVRRM